MTSERDFYPQPLEDSTSCRTERPGTEWRDTEWSTTEQSATQPPDTERREGD